ncbi:MAG: TIGR03790 family protein, partial [Thermoplasmata archaeon]
MYPLDRRALAVILVLLLPAPALMAVVSPVAAEAGGEIPFPDDARPEATSNVTVVSVTYPRYLDPFDYSDVLVLINNNSAMSKQVGEYFADARNVPSKQVAYLDVPAREVITKDQYEDLEDQVKTYMLRNNLVSDINYIVTTKGFPLKIHNTSNWYRACVDEELALIYGPQEGTIGGFAWTNSPYYGDRTYFDRGEQGIYLVNRLTGYDWDDVKGLVDRANDTIGNRGKYVLDVDPTKGYSTGGYGVGNLWLRNARDILVPRGEEVFFDETRWYVNYQEDVMGYGSWGSNDANDTDHAKPHNTWINGSIAETFVSTGGRTFTYPPRYGQSMIADIIAENVTGVKGYVYEPYLSAIAHPDTLFERYTAGFNLAESYRMASVYLGWMGVVVGDPKCAPYRDIPDLDTDDTLISPSNSTPATGAEMSVNLQVRNHGGRVEDANLTLYVDGQPWVVENLTFEAFSLTTLRITIDAPEEEGTFAIKAALNEPLGFFETLYDNNEAFTYITTQKRPEITLHASNVGPMTLDSVRFDIRVLDSRHPITLFTFDFDDGTDRMVLQTNVTYHAFDQDGTYNVTAWVLDSNMVLSLKANLTVTVANRAPLPIISVDEDTRLTGEVFTFNATASDDLDGAVVSADWDFGDENTSAGWSVPHSYRWPGEYVVRLTVTDDDGAQAWVTRRVYVLNRAPVASFVQDNDEVWKGRMATLNASGSSDPDGRIAQYEWDFGDGSEGEVVRGPLVNHVFESAGEVTVTLTVVDDMGATATVQAVVTVLNRAPTVEVSVGQEEVWTGDTVELDGSRSFDEDGEIVDYEFRVIGDGNEEVARFAGPSPTATWEPEDDGEYRINLLVTDNDGATTESWTVLPEPPSVIVHNRAPTVLRDGPTEALHQSVVDAPDTLAVGVEARDADGTVSSILWFLGDTTTQLANGASVTIDVDVEGPLDVRVVVTDDDGAESVVWFNVTVNEAPEAAFDVTLEGEALDIVDVHPREMLAFDATNSYDPGGIARFQWDFGDGFQQEGVLASHAY